MSCGEYHIGDRVTLYAPSIRVDYRGKQVEVDSGESGVVKEVIRSNHLLRVLFNRLDDAPVVVPAKYFNINY
jgi:hypothetical protein